MISDPNLSQLLGRSLGALNANDLSWLEGFTATEKGARPVTIEHAQSGWRIAENQSYVGFDLTYAYEHGWRVSYNANGCCKGRIFAITPLSAAEQLASILGKSAE